MKKQREKRKLLRTFCHLNDVWCHKDITILLLSIFMTCFEVLYSLRGNGCWQRWQGREGWQQRYFVILYKLQSWTKDFYMVLFWKAYDCHVVFKVEWEKIHITCMVLTAYLSIVIEWRWFTRSIFIKFFLIVFVQAQHEK